jgi:peptidoglycan/xylan/chitin deacetylase (PgdA/CDA1 family)
MYLSTVPDFVKPFFGKNLLWNADPSDNAVYLTFDDGPVYDATIPILKILEQFGVKATFFCVGENVLHHHDLYLNILQQGHRTGNHTYNHLKGWNTSLQNYIENVRLCRNLVDSNLFRPPYGRISKQQISALQEEYTIVMWTLLAGDFDLNLSKEDCLKRLINKIQPGSIIVLHDNLKTREMINFVLPRFLENALERSFKFKTLG